MKTRVTVLISMMAGIVTGAAAVHALHARAKPPAYVVGEIDIRNVELFDKEYVPDASKAVRDGGGEYLVGEASPSRSTASLPGASSSWPSKASTRPRPPSIPPPTRKPRRPATSMRPSASMPWKA